nr:hypothetical protein QOL21_03165 [Acholeplasma laidlawii]
MTTSMTDEHGFVSLSVGNVYERDAIDQADLVIIEVNPNFPRTFGDNNVHLREVDYVIESSYPIPSIPDLEPNDKDRVIGNLIAEKINNGDTIQIGIGGIPNAVASALMGKKI